VHLLSTDGLIGYATAKTDMMFSNQYKVLIITDSNKWRNQNKLSTKYDTITVATLEKKHKFRCTHSVFLCYLHCRPNDIINT